MYNAANDTGIALDLSGDPALTNLAPLAGLPLTQLNLAGSQVSDISPLKDMPLEYLNLSGCKVSDLKPLAGSPLKKLNLDQCPVESLQDINGLQLNELSLWKTEVGDLNPLRRMPLTYLNLVSTYVGDLNPIADLPLQTLCLGWTQAFGGQTPPKESMPDKWWQQLQDLNMTWGNIYLKQNEAEGSYLEIKNTDATQDSHLAGKWTMLNGAKAMTISFKYRSTLEGSSADLGSSASIFGDKANRCGSIWGESIVCEATNVWTAVKKTIPIPARVEHFAFIFIVRQRIGTFDVKDIRVVLGDGSAAP